MDIKDYLSVTGILIDVPIGDKTRLLKELSTHVAAATGLGPTVVAAEILKREDLGSTGIGNGVAIPHARIEGLKNAHGVLARLREPIAFDAIDERPVDIVFVLLLPESAEGEQFSALACVARKLRDPDTLRGLRGAASSAALYDAMVTN